MELTSNWKKAVNKKSDSIWQLSQPAWKMSPQHAVPDFFYYTPIKPSVFSRVFSFSTNLIFYPLRHVVDSKQDAFISLHISIFGGVFEIFNVRLYTSCNPIRFFSFDASSKLICLPQYVPGPNLFSCSHFHTRNCYCWINVVFLSCCSSLLKRLTIRSSALL